MYRRKYGKLVPGLITEFLILDKEFPRSILYCLKKAERALLIISGNQTGGFSNLAEKKIGSIRSEIEFFDMDDIIISGLHEYLDGLQTKIGEISKEVYNCYLSANIK